MEWITNNIANILIFLGIALLAFEVIVLGFTGVIFFFLGLGCLLTGLVIFAGVFPATFSGAIVSVGVLTAISAVGLWKPLKRMQNSTENKDVQSDFLSHSFVLESNIGPDEFGSHQYSGVKWKVKSDQNLAAGTNVEVSKAEVGVLTVVAKS
jgi:membrane protein implicated in regulation of membrane protease activity